MDLEQWGRLGRVLQLVPRVAAAQSRVLAASLYQLS